MKETNKQRKSTPLPKVEDINLYDYYFGKLLMYTTVGLIILAIGLML